HLLRAPRLQGCRGAPPAAWPEALADVACPSPLINAGRRLSPRGAGPKRAPRADRKRLPDLPATSQDRSRKTRHRISGIREAVAGVARPRRANASPSGPGAGRWTAGAPFSRSVEDVFGSPAELRAGLRSYSSRGRGASLRGGDLPAAPGALLGSPRRSLSPQLLQPVELARLGREDVHHHVEVIHEDPVGPTGALDAARQRAVLAL